MTKIEAKTVTTAHAEGVINNAKSTIVNFAWWMKRQGYAEATIEGRIRLLKVLLKRGADLYNPESVKGVIALQTQWSNARKELAVNLYTSYLRMVGGKWNPPKYKRVRKLPFIPTNAEIDQLIAGCGPKTSTFLQFLKETGARCGEAWKLEWTDLDVENSTVRITPEKGSNPRIFKISGKLLSMLNALPRTSKKVFGGTKLRTMRRTFEYSRKRLADQLKNPRLLKITFHTFRHFKATMEYHKTKDILHVMDILGHRNIQNTLIYTHLVNFQDDEYVTKVANAVEEDCKLIEAGFEYVTERDGLKIYRKRK